MSIKPINHYSLTNSASIYDEEALTALELSARTAAKCNEVIENLNKNQQLQQELSKEMTDKVTEFSEYVNEKATEIENFISSGIKNQIVYSFSRIDGTHNFGDFSAPIRGNQTITIAAGLYHYPGGYIKLTESKTITTQISVYPYMLYLVYNGDFTLKSKEAIVYNDVILCGVYFYSEEIVTFHNDALFARYDTNYNVINEKSERKRELLYEGFAYDGAIYIDTVNHTVQIIQPLKINCGGYGNITVKTTGLIPYDLLGYNKGTFLLTLSRANSDDYTFNLGYLPALVSDTNFNVSLGGFSEDGKLLGYNFSDDFTFNINGNGFYARDIKPSPYAVNIPKTAQYDAGKILSVDEQGTPVWVEIENVEGVGF